MAKPPVLSVIVITRNNGDKLQETFESLRAQTFQDFELLIVDDGSTDDTWGQIHALDWKRLRAHYNETPLGEAAAINQAFEWAEGEYFALHRAGDVSHPKRFAKQLERMRRGATLGAVGCYADWVDRDGALLRHWEPATGHKSIMVQLEMEGEAFTILGVPVAAVQGTLMFRADAVTDVGGLREGLRTAAVVDLLRRLARDYKLANLKEVLYTATYHPDDPFFDDYLEGRIYAALALQLAEERERYDAERTNFEEAVKLIDSRDEQLGYFAQRAERAANYMRWAETFEAWGDTAAPHARQMWLRALKSWPLEPGVWRFATRRLRRQEMDGERQ
ncbi:MAG TPA: glycosyltransferase family 2 protein [Aggregatilineales bacterium]|nr:glycosyltransferase family 2 protein [Aggregatilineales bacterium]